MIEHGDFVIQLINVVEPSQERIFRILFVYNFFVKSNASWLEGLKVYFHFNRDFEFLIRIKLGCHYRARYVRHHKSLSSVPYSFKHSLLQHAAL
jgi:hypothetical protein